MLDTDLFTSLHTCVNLSRSAHTLALSLSHTHTHARSHARTHTQTHTHSSLQQSCTSTSKCVVSCEEHCRIMKRWALLKEACDLKKIVSFLQQFMTNTFAMSMPCSSSRCYCLAPICPLMGVLVCTHAGLKVRCG